MNPQIQALINLINQIFRANGNQEITGTNSNAVLQAIVNALYDITGDPQFLNTIAKDNLVNAINELDDQIGQINTIKLFSGTQNPNTIDVNGGDYEVRDFYMQTSGSGTIALWIYTGIQGNGWVNLNQRDVIEVNSLPLSGITGVIYIRTSDETLWRWKSTGGGNQWILLNKTELISVDNLPSEGISDILYMQKSDNTLWRWQAGGSVQYPVSVWVSLGGGGITPENYVSYDLQTPTLEQQANARENIGITTSSYEQVFTFDLSTNPEQEFELDFEATDVQWCFDTNTMIFRILDEFTITGTTLKINYTMKDEAIIIIRYEHE